MKGLGPGPYDEYSWLLQKNVIPVYDYEHHKYKAAKGHDFKYDSILVLFPETLF